MNDVQKWLPHKPLTWRMICHCLKDLSGCSKLQKPCIVQGQNHVSCTTNRKTSLIDIKPSCRSSPHIKNSVNDEVSELAPEARPMTVDRLDLDAKYDCPAGIADHS